MMSAPDNRPVRAPPPGEGDTQAALIQTVLGPIGASQLGFTLPLEHIFTSSMGFMRVWPEFFGGREQLIEKAARQLETVKSEGVRTIVDLTTSDLGRDIRLAQEVAERSGMQIIACTGFWHQPSPSMASRTIDEIADFFFREIDRGIEDTNVKAGIIKVATDVEGLTPFIENTIRAAARVSKTTGVPIKTHTHALPPNPTGRLQAEVFESEGISTANISIAHSDNSSDFEYLTRLLVSGYWLGMDHMSRGLLPPGYEATPEIEPFLWRPKTRRIKQLIDLGYVDQLLLSNDWLFADSVFPSDVMIAMEQANPDGMLFLSRKVIPYLKDLGVSDQDIQTLTIKNPARFLSGSIMPSEAPPAEDHG